MSDQSSLYSSSCLRGLETCGHHSKTAQLAAIMARSECGPHQTCVHHDSNAQLATDVFRLKCAPGWDGAGHEDLVAHLPHAQLLLEGLIPGCTHHVPCRVERIGICRHKNAYESMPDAIMYGRSEMTGALSFMSCTMTCTLFLYAPASMPSSILMQRACVIEACRLVLPLSRQNAHPAAG